MFAGLVLIIFICQCNSPNVSAENEARRMGSIDIFKTLLSKVFKDPELYLNIADYPLKAMMKQLLPRELFARHLYYFNMTRLKTEALCIFCNRAVKSFIQYSRHQENPELLKSFAHLLCNLLMHLVNPSVCKALVNLNLDVLLYIVLHSKQLTSKQACAIIVQKYSCFKSMRPDWSIPIPTGNSVKLQPPTRSGKSFKVLQITDPHMDSMYTPGANAKCGKPLCCQSDQGQRIDGAGQWADYRDCDMPWYTLEHLLEDIMQSNTRFPEISYVYFTGDIISHRIWDTSIESNTKEIKKMFRTLKEKLPGIRVFPIIGNHESHPLNLFSPLSVPERYSTRWLYDLVVEEWSLWLPDSALATLRTGGYYTVLVEPGFRIIALNSNVCYTFNWWLLYQNIDPYRQLRWLVRELQKAEQNREIVHILSHSPPGESECLTAWSREFQKIVERFAYTIAAQFNGHTHYDELRIFYNTSNIDQAIGVAFNGGSFTSFSDVNPNVRTYSISAETFEVVNYREWIFQVPIANFFRNQPPQWYQLYSFKHAYGLNNLEFYSLNNLVERMTKEEQLLKDYYRFQVRDSETGMLKGCNRTCMINNLCSIVTTVFDDNEKCDELKSKLAI